ncbi:uncharacterized protein BDZ99DRAFT_408981 [Mytilinidion resinicola]|uniref:Cytochrome b5 heme-binding domain-containing protein n=1 Tax=Mytilinidion resinicola TaxID=574789 RepID=A0A6A6Z309_9PEZI|nr:uncharacterized protein BDZ99DRAFT_408981 [Mytilinidion resinicola]KAF2815208.1 hypothetical protein BDZ99DRAFT_408981 [Mytilinidion resinicola]
MLVGVTAFIISLSILFYRHPPPSWPLWAFFMAPRRGQLSDPPSQTSREPPDETTVAHEVSKNNVTPPNAVIRETANGVDPAPSPQTTPKAVPVVANAQLVPSFSLGADEGSDDEDEEDIAPPPSFPAVNSAQRASAKPPAMGPPPPKPPPAFAQPRSSQFMAPPPRVAASNLRALPTTANSLRIPSRGPLPNRGMPVSNSLGLSSSAPIRTPNQRNKVQLTPGHSPLDWANMQKSGNNLSGVSSLVRVTPTQLKYNNGRKERPAWSSYQGKVYNITPYLPFHPGGEGELRRAAGKDGGKLFMEVHPWVNWENMLGECLVGIMVAENDVKIPQSSALEDMD